MKSNPIASFDKASRPRIRVWFSRFALGSVLLLTVALPASAADPLPDVACGRGGDTCPFVGEFSAFGVETITLSEGQQQQRTFFLPSILAASD